MLETEYFDFLVPIFFFVFVTIFNWVGFTKRIPLLQVVSIGMTIFSAVSMIEVTPWVEFTMLFVLVNLVLFILGMIKHYGA